jgi:hypothetical protein
MHVTCASVHVPCASAHVTCVSVHVTCISVHIKCISVHITCVSVHVTCVNWVPRLAPVIFRQTSVATFLMCTHRPWKTAFIQHSTTKTHPNFVCRCDSQQHLCRSNPTFTIYICKHYLNEAFDWVSRKSFEVLMCTCHWRNRLLLQEPILRSWVTSPALLNFTTPRVA